MKEKLMSRKFWVVVATFVAGMATIFLDIEVDPEALVGVAAIVVAYLGGQSWVDGKAATATATDVTQNQLDHIDQVVAAQSAIDEAIAYARRLETQLSDAG